MNLKVLTNNCCQNFYPQFAISQGAYPIKQCLTGPCTAIQNVAKWLFEQLASLYQACLTFKARIWTYSVSASQSKDEPNAQLFLPAFKSDHCYVMPLAVDFSQFNQDELLAFENAFWGHIQQALANDHLFTEHPILSIEIRLIKAKSEYTSFHVPRSILERVLKQKENYSLPDLLQTHVMTFNDGQTREMNGFLQAILCQDSDYFRVLLPAMDRQKPNSQENPQLCFKAFNWNTIFDCSSLAWDKAINVLYSMEFNDNFKGCRALLEISYSVKQRSSEPDKQTRGAKSWSQRAIETVKKNMPQFIVGKPVRLSKISHSDELHEFSSFLYIQYLSAQLLTLTLDDLLEWGIVIGQFQFNKAWNGKLFELCSEAIWQKLGLILEGKDPSQNGPIEVEASDNISEDESIDEDPAERFLTPENFESLCNLYAFSQTYAFGKLQKNIGKMIDAFLQKVFYSPERFSQLIDILKTTSDIQYLSQLTLPVDCDSDLEDDYPEENIECLKGLPIKAINLKYRSQVIEKGLTVLKDISCLEKLSLEDLKLRQDHFYNLEGLNIKRLFFRNCSYSLFTEGFDCLTRLPLEELSTDEPQGFIPYIKQMPHLRMLKLFNLNDYDFQQLSSSSLKVLDISRCKNLSNGFYQIHERFPVLEDLNLQSCSIKDEHFDEIQQLPLKRLNVNSCPLKGDFLKKIKSMTQLEELDLSYHFNLKTEDFQKLESRTLKKLNLCSCRSLTQEALKDLHKRLPVLEELKLVSYRIHVTDAWIEELKSMPNLKKLYVDEFESKITKETLQLAETRGLSIIFTSYTDWKW